MSGLTPAGFERKRLIDIISDIETRLKSGFNANIDLQAGSVFGQFLGIVSEVLSDQWEGQENVYLSQSPSTAQGNQLSNLVLLNGIERQNASYSTVTATLTGLTGTTIPQGSLASVVSTGAQFATDTEVIFTDGTLEVTMTAVETGPIAAVAGTLTVIDSPIYGWTAITNNADAVLGRDEETDAALRIRRTLSTQALGNNLVDSLFGQLLNLDDVIDAVVISNGTNVTVDGIPAHQFLTSIKGGDDDEIAQTIWNNTPQGILSFGTTSVFITDQQGFQQEVKFTRPTDVNIYFKIDITTDPLVFPGSGETDIRDAIVLYGTNNFKISDDVILSRFYTPINETAGITSIALYIGFSVSPTGTSNLTIDLDEVPVFSTSNIEINVT